MTLCHNHRSVVMTERQEYHLIPVYSCHIINIYHGIHDNLSKHLNVIKILCSFLPEAYDGSNGHPFSPNKSLIC